MEKNELRQNVIVSLKSLARQAVIKQEKEQELYNDLFYSEEWKNAEHLALTYSMPIELDTLPIIQQAWEEGKKVYLPSSHPNGIMHFHLFTKKTSLRKSKFGVLEPETHDIINKNVLDLILVPGVVYQKSGYRIGFGGGYYDRFLADFTGKTCSLVFSEQIRENWTPDPYDIAVDQLIIN